MASNEIRKSIDSTPSLAKRPRISTPDFKDEAVREQEKKPSVGSASKKGTLTDLSVFDCSICDTPLIYPVYQCENGHVACGTCCTEIKNKCPSCCSPIGTNRCIALEKVLDTVTVSCRNVFRGCTKTFKLSRKYDHEEIECHHKPSVCPYDNCNYVDVSESLFKHFGKTHRPSTLLFNNVKSIVIDTREAETLFFQDVSQGTLFVLKSVIEARGIFLTVVCVGSDSMSEAFSFNMSAEFENDMYVKIKGGVACVQELTGRSGLVNCLLVPRGLVYNKGKLNLKLVLWRNPVPAVGGSGECPFC